MNKRLIILIILILIVVAGGIYVAFRVNQDNQAASNFTLVKETGTVFFKKPTDSDYVTASELDTTLPAGSFVKTDKDSYARVFLPDSSLISIDQKSEIQISFGGNKVDINQLIGNTWNRVQTVVNGGEYKVQTPNAIATVRGTIFGVNVDSKDLTKIFVQKSKVDASRYDIENGDIKILETVTLNEGEMATIVKDAKSFRIEKGKIPDDLLNSFWFKRNLIIDEIYLKLGDLKGLDLIKGILNELQNNPSYNIFLFGLTPPGDTTPEDIKTKLSKVDDITKITDKTCTGNTQPDFQLAIDEVNAYSAYINNVDRLKTLLSDLKNSCTDGQLSLSESSLLQKEVTDIKATN